MDKRDDCSKTNWNHASAPLQRNLYSTLSIGSVYTLRLNSEHWAATAMWNCACMFPSVICLACARSTWDKILCVDEQGAPVSSMVSFFRLLHSVVLLTSFCFVLLIANYSYQTVEWSTSETKRTVYHALAADQRSKNSVMLSARNIYFSPSSAKQ